MVIGNVMLALSLLIMMVFFRGLPDSVAGLRWAIYIIAYIIYVLGYTCQCACTKAGQTCLTNDPKQRSQFMIWNMIASSAPSCSSTSWRAASSPTRPYVKRVC